MKIISLATSLFFVCAVVATAQEAKKFTFEGKVGSLPKGWKTEKTGKGTGGDWQIVEDKDAVGGLSLAQTKADRKALFNICVNEGARYKDIDLTVKFKAIAGETDQGGGPVWRFQDGNNYYIARMNPLEDNFRVYKVTGGKRSAEFQNADVTIPAGEWHTLKIKMAGNHIECFLDGKKYLDVKDDSIAAAGKVGLWTKADAQTSFDQFRVSGLKK